MTTTPVIAFFNNKGGVGKTSLVYHLAWMYADMGVRVLAADLDPQANLTSAFLDEDRLEELWGGREPIPTIFGAIQPLIRRTGDIAHISGIRPDDALTELSLLVGDPALAQAEDLLFNAWAECSQEDEGAFRVTSAIGRIVAEAASHHSAQLVLFDLGPNLGAINRAALIAADYIIIPLTPDLFSLRNLKNSGPVLRQWRKEWSELRSKQPTADLTVPTGRMCPLGYILQQHSIRLDRPVKPYEKWIARIPGVYREAVMDEPEAPDVSVTNDPYAIALLKHYRSLMPMAQEARKPMFHLRPADGAIGSHFEAAQAAYRDFRDIARTVAERTGILLPETSAGIG